ncbi:MAG: coproporphyrinogen-III oxidase family protein [Candidatus Paceibacterota bacterium]
MSKNHAARQLPQPTRIGAVFVSNYPPYGTWDQESVSHVLDQFASAPNEQNGPLGLYVHVPFCRKRCAWCWYKVNEISEHAPQMKAYLNALGAELELYAELPAFRGRPLQHIHFGGGTPSLITTKHLRPLFSRMKAAFPWTDVEEVTIECEPGTLSRDKVAELRALGVTRISLGVQSFNDEILAASNRLHTAAQSVEAFSWVRNEDFRHVSIDLLAGLPGETDENWRDTVARALELGPDAVSIYQMELPTNTILARTVGDGGAAAFADWKQKRDWAAYAFEAFEAAEFVVTDSRSLIKKEKRMSVSPSLYQDGLNTGMDLVAIGASPFGYVGDTQYQNLKRIDEYLSSVTAGSLPLARGVQMSKRTRFIRELVLQLKTGSISRGHFHGKFGLDPAVEYSDRFERLEHDGFLEPISKDAITLTRNGLLQVDFWLPELYESDVPIQ